MEKKNPKTGQAAVQGRPSKPAKKKRRILLWLFLTVFLLGTVTLASFYFRLIPLEPEMAAKIEPYIVKMEAYVDKIHGDNKVAEEIAGKNPQTNFPLVELEENKKTAAPPAAVAPAGLLGAPAIASASPAQPAAGATKPAGAIKESADTVKVYGKLAKLYSAMKPEEAVAVFNNLEDEQVILILARMDDEAAGKILAAIEARKAARLTQAMIKRK